MKTKFLILAVLGFALFFAVQAPALAAAFPLPLVEVFLKSLTTRQVVAGNTDENGNFNVRVPEESGEFNLFIGNQNMTLVKMSAKKNIVSGRIVILTEGTVAKDPDPAPAPVITPALAPVVKAKKSAPILTPVKKVKPTVKQVMKKKI